MLSKKEHWTSEKHIIQLKIYKQMVNYCHKLIQADFRILGDIFKL